MARPARPIPEGNPFLNGQNIVPPTTLSEKLGLSPEARHNIGDDREQSRSEESEVSDDLSENGGEVDASVQAEMDKLETTFDEIGLKFRLIDRIGEGNESRRQIISLVESPDLCSLQALSPLFTKPKIYTMTTIRMTGTSNQEMPRNGRHLP